MGNSEVGHLNLGAGTVVKQDLARIDEAIEDGRASSRTRRCARACAAARERGGALHLIGLVSAGGVHSSLGHLRGVHRAGRARAGARDRAARVHRRPRHAAHVGARSTSRRRRRGSPRPPRRGVPARVGVRDGPLLGDGPRQPLGPHEARLRRDRARRGPDARRARRTPSGRPTAATRRTSSSSRRSSGEPRPLRGRRQRRSRSTSAPTGCARSCGRWASRTSPSSTAAASRACTSRR